MARTEHGVVRVLAHLLAGDELLHFAANASMCTEKHMHADGAYYLCSLSTLPEQALPEPDFRRQACCATYQQPRQPYARTVPLEVEDPHDSPRIAEGSSQ